MNGNFTKKNCTRRENGESRAWSQACLVNLNPGFQGSLEETLVVTQNVVLQLYTIKFFIFLFIPMQAKSYLKSNC